MGIANKKVCKLRIIFRIVLYVHIISEIERFLSTHRRFRRYLQPRQRWCVYVRVCGKEVPKWRQSGQTDNRFGHSPRLSGGSVCVLCVYTRTHKGVV